MELIKNKSFGGERPLFGAHDVRLEDITITDGESGIKCCQNIDCHHSKFYGKYLGGMWTDPLSQTATSPQKAVLPSGIVIIW